MCLINSRSICNKTTILNELVLDNDLDIVAITETWLQKDDTFSASDMTPVGYSFKHIDRNIGRAGGVGLLHRSSISVTVLNNNETINATTIEYIKCSVTICKTNYTIIVIYRPPPTKTNKLQNGTFFDEIYELLVTDLITKSNLIICGDFNYHMDKADDINTKRLNSILNELGLIQHVNEPTHNSGHTLDLIITREDENCINSIEVADMDISDHYCITFNINIHKPCLKKKTIQFRQLHKINKDIFSRDIYDCFKDLGNLDTEELVDIYNSQLRTLLNNHAPLRTKEVFERQDAKWYNSDLKMAKRERRKLERKWRLTGTEKDKDAYRQQNKVVNRKILTAKTNYYCDKINDTKGDQKSLYKIVNNLMHRKAVLTLPSQGSTLDVCNRFSQYFTEKISIIRDKLTLDNTINPVSTSPVIDAAPVNIRPLSRFEPITLEETSKMLRKSACKSCDLDPIPTSMLKEYGKDTVPIITIIINASLNEASVPGNLKQALLTPTIKKQDIDKESVSNYRPISNLPFISKLIEKTVSKQLHNHQRINNLCEKLQSAYKEGHSTETALVKVHNDISLALDKNKSVILVLLDLSAAFDTVDHDILIKRLETLFNIKDNALEWFKSYLTNRHQTVKISNARSDEVELKCGVPQGSILGPVLFTAYTTPLGLIAAKHNINFHCYADDIQLYCTFTTNNREELQLNKTNIQTCIKDIKTWMRINYLKLNDKKTELLVITRKNKTNIFKDFSLKIDNETIETKNQIRNLGVMFGEFNTMNGHIQTTCKNAYYQIRHIYKIRRFLTQEATKTLVHGLVLSKIDYSNALLQGLPKIQIKKLQRLQNCAARLITKTRKFDHITPILIQLHWLPIEARILYKTLVITFKAKHNLGPPYLNELIVDYNPSRPLRSQDKNLLMEPTYNTDRYGAQAFRNSAPRCWNKLPSEIREAPILDTFKKQLKFYLFRQYYEHYI